LTKQTLFESTGSFGCDDDVRLALDSTIGLSNLAAQNCTAYPWLSSVTNVTYGSPTELWGFVNVQQNATLSFRLTVRATNASANFSVSIDYAWATIYYQGMLC
jgi:hypothetical protein